MSIRPFTPAQEAGEDLDRRTVGRDALLAVLAERLRLAATTRTRLHTLLVGPRGSGKTHLLQVALHRAEADPHVSGGVAVAVVAEDAVGLTGYVDLLRELARGLGVDVGQERDASAAERALLGAAGERTLVIVVENLDRVFRAIGVPGQRDLRSWVETSGRVLILSATPALFDSVRERDKPWFGGLIETPVAGLTASEGRELLTRLARDRGDQALVDALQSERGASRIEAVSQLTAGSPRIWMVLSECLSVESLDELIPAVEGLVEGLVPYYQSLLWDLPHNHQAIVRLLAEGRSAAMTASEIARETGLSQQTVSKALGLLKEGRWVRGDKLSEGDQRGTWYTLREPMLRHHFQWRASDGEPLRLIVDLLREWYDPTELRRQLSLAEPESLGESYLAESLRATPPTYDFPMNTGTPEALLAVAREWLRDGDAVHPPESGLLAELCVTLTQDAAADIATLVRRRSGKHPHLHVPRDELLAELVVEASAGAQLPRLLQTAAAGTTGDAAASLLLVAAGLVGREAPRRSCELLAGVQADPGSALGLALELERAFWASKVGDAQDSLAVVSKLLPEIESALGPNDPMALTARGNLAAYMGRLGDAAEALRLYQELLLDLVRVLGPEDRDTLTTRGQVAYYTGVVGDAAEALRLYQELLLDRVRVLGPEDRDTLSSRAQVAYYTGVVGDAAEALRLYQELLPDADRALGGDNPLTQLTRRGIEVWSRREADEHGVTLLLERARAGDPEARMRLPAELRPLAGDSDS